MSEEEEEVAIDPVSAALLAGDNEEVVALVGKVTVPMEEVPTSPERRLRSGKSDQLPEQTSPERVTLETGPVRKVEMESAAVDLVGERPGSSPARQAKARKGGRKRLSTAERVALSSKAQEEAGSLDTTQGSASPGRKEVAGGQQGDGTPLAVAEVAFYTVSGLV